MSRFSLEALCFWGCVRYGAVIRTCDLVHRLQELLGAHQTGAIHKPVEPHGIFWSLGTGLPGKGTQLCRAPDAFSKNILGGWIWG